MFLAFTNRSEFANFKILFIWVQGMTRKNTNKLLTLCKANIVVNLGVKFSVKKPTYDTD